MLAGGQYSVELVFVVLNCHILCTMPVASFVIEVLAIFGSVVRTNRHTNTQAECFTATTLVGVSK